MLTRQGRPDHFVTIGLSLLLVLLTGGLYYFYWTYLKMQTCNRYLGRNEFRWLIWLVLCPLTLGSIT